MHQVESSPSALSEPEILLTGCVPRACALSVEDLQRLPNRTLGPMEIVCLTGRHVASVDSHRGVLLSDVLALTGLPELPREVRKECLIIARGSDGYRALFSWNELYNTAIGEGVFVVFERNDRVLDARTGRFALISASDLRAGPRHLRQLCEIKVLRITG